jgi:hypothetical protein
MTKRTERKTSSKTIPDISDAASLDTMEKRVIALAEQLGRIAGAAQAKTESWLDQPTFRDQLAKIRDGATDLLEHFASRTSSQDIASRQKTSPAGRGGGKVDAPGKKHRKAPAALHGVKHSDQRISKANAARQMRRGRQRQG